MRIGLVDDYVSAGKLGEKETHELQRQLKIHFIMTQIIILYLSLDRSRPSIASCAGFQLVQWSRDPGED